jgi:broad specificity phosphatase PhoE
MLRIVFGRASGRRAFFVLASLLCAWQCRAATVILVRHAERADAMETDPPLNERGKQRAEALARMLANAGVQTIYTSEVQRTRQTAAPLAKQLKVEPVVVPARDLEGLAARLNVLPENAVVLVIGHSNTLPKIVTALGGAAEPLTESEYDRMIIVRLCPGGPPSVLTLRY